VEKSDTVSEQWIPGGADGKNIPGRPGEKIEALTA
jgi:hypothetical protein